MNNAPSGPPMRGAAFDSWRSLRDNVVAFTGMRTKNSEDRGTQVWGNCTGISGRPKWDC